MSSSVDDRTDFRRQATWKDYLRIARLDHSTKHIFIFPGIAFALALTGLQNDRVVLQILFGLVSAVSIASANYVINEWLDRDFDKYHPTKSARAAVQAELNPRYVVGLWLFFVGIGCLAAAASSMTMLIVALLFACQGVVYNVPPVRTKDRAFLDVISESINNPFRLLIGWLMIDASTIPPASIILAYWFGGAYLMAAKRWSEYREICASNGRNLLIKYRKSFVGYSEARLLSSCFLYALCCMSLFSIFMIKYRIEYLLVIPALCIMFAVYIGVSMRQQSVAQAPERLFQDKSLMLAVALVVSVTVTTTFVDIPWLEEYADQRFIVVQWQER